jgi:hypothetical protein
MKLPRTEEEARSYFRDSLLRLREMAMVLDGQEVCDAIDVATAIIQRPGPLDRPALAPAVKLVHRRMAVLMRRGARETTGSVRAQLIRGAKAADADAKIMEQVILELGKPTLS